MRVSFLLVLAALLVGCGNKGDLYLPQDDNAAAVDSTLQIDPTEEKRGNAEDGSS